MSAAAVLAATETMAPRPMAPAPTAAVAATVVRAPSAILEHVSDAQRTRQFQPEPASLIERVVEIALERLEPAGDPERRLALPGPGGEPGAHRKDRRTHPQGVGWIAGPPARTTWRSDSRRRAAVSCSSAR
jgi:hypothetical protein